jgi:hypothetical protein
MRRLVRRHADFEADYLALLADLVARGEREWIVTLADGLEDVGRMLSRFPAAGPRLGSFFGDDRRRRSYRAKRQ